MLKKDLSFAEPVLGRAAASATVVNAVPTACDTPVHDPRTVADAATRTFHLRIVDRRGITGDAASMTPGDAASMTPGDAPYRVVEGWASSIHARGCAQVGDSATEVVPLEDACATRGTPSKLFDAQEAPWVRIADLAHPTPCAGTDGFERWRKREGRLSVSRLGYDRDDHVEGLVRSRRGALRRRWKRRPPLLYEDGTAGMTSDSAASISAPFWSSTVPSAGREGARSTSPTRAISSPLYGGLDDVTTPIQKV